MMTANFWVSHYFLCFNVELIKKTRGNEGREKEKEREKKLEMDGRTYGQMDRQTDGWTKHLPIQDSPNSTKKVYKVGQGYHSPYDASWRLVPPPPIPPPHSSQI